MGLILSKMFILTCPEEDNTSFPAFMDIMMVFMKSELAKEPDMFEVGKYLIAALQPHC